MAIYTKGFLRLEPTAYGLDPRWWTVLLCIGLGLFSCCGQANADADYKTVRPARDRSYAAVVNITYRDPQTGEMRSEKNEIGKYGTNKFEAEWGWVVHVRTADGSNHGCNVFQNSLSTGERWIALIKRGECKFHDKISNAVFKSNASAVVVYNHEVDDLLTMDHRDHADVPVHSTVAIFISKHDGMHIAQLVDNGTRVLMHITVGHPMPLPPNPINKTSVLFVSISFIVLMIISLAWLVFYYIQRFRYAHAKERLSKRLMNAAKKAIVKMPMRTIKNGDRETESDFDQCAVCIEGYKSADVIRVLPCKHMFHKSCVDPWLIEQRSCPMCKLDILKAYGMQMQGSHESMAHIELDTGSSMSMARNEPGQAVPAVTAEDPAPPRLEILQYQPAQVEYHEMPVEDAVTAVEPEGTVVSIPILSRTRDALETVPMAPTDSMESVHSTESDSNETQSLMPQHKEKSTNGGNGVPHDIEHHTS